MARTKLFMNNRTQAVRLPKAVAFPAGVREVEIVKRGNSRIIRPVSKGGWDQYFRHGTRPTADFMTEREQPAAEEREPFL